MKYPRQKCESDHRSKSFVDYYKDGDPIKYCYGYIDKANDEPLECWKEDEGGEN